MTTLHPVYGTPVPSRWETFTADEVRSPERYSCVAGPFGSNISSKYFAPEGIPVIRGSNLTDDLVAFVPEGFVFVTRDRASTYLPQHVHGGDLVFTCWGTIGQVGLVPENGPYPEYIISNKQLKLRPDLARFDPHFLYYYFASPRMIEHIRGRAVGSAVPGINLGILKSLPVVAPPLPTQRKIAAILDAYDRQIENNQSRIGRLQEIASRIYLQWFVRFHYSGYDDGSLVDSARGPIPQGWTLTPLSDLATVTMGQSPPSTAYNAVGDGLPFHQGVGTYGSYFPRHTVFSTEGTRIANDGDVLVSVRAPVGRINIADRRLILGRGLAGIAPAQAPRGFLLQTLLYFFREEDNIGNGAIFNSVTRSDMESLPVVWPNGDLVERFEQIAAPLYEEISLLTKANDVLRSTRNLLLPRLISGQLNVDELHIQVPEEAA